MCHQLLPQWHKSLQLQKAFWLHICKSTNSFSHCWQKKKSFVETTNKDFKCVKYWQRKAEKEEIIRLTQSTEKKATCVFLCVCLSPYRDGDMSLKRQFNSQKDPWHTALFDKSATELFSNLAKEIQQQGDCGKLCSCKGMRYTDGPEWAISEWRVKCMSFETSVEFF